MTREARAALEELEAATNELGNLKLNELTEAAPALYRRGRAAEALARFDWSETELPRLGAALESGERLRRRLLAVRREITAELERLDVVRNSVPRLEKGRRLDLRG